MKSVMNSRDESEGLFYERPFRYYIKTHRRPFLIGMGALLATNVMDALPPLILKRGIDQVLEGAQLSELAITTGLFFFVIGGVALFRYGWRIFFGRFHHVVAEDLRGRIFEKFTILGPSFFQRNPVGQLMSLISNDVNSFRMAIGPGFLVLFDAFFVIAIVLPLMLSLSVSWTWKTLVLLPLIPFVINRVEKTMNERYRLQQDRFSEVSGVTQEIISGIRVIKSYGQEENQTRLFNEVSRKYEDACNSSALVDSYFQPVMEFGVASGSVLLLLYATPDVMTGAMTIGSLVAFHRYIQKMIWPMTAIGFGISFVQQGKASFERITELLRTESDIPDEGVVELDHFEKLEIQDLTFKYPHHDEEVLKRVSLTIRSGEAIGFVGAVGAGKSTLAQLMCRLYPVAENTILFNGHSIEKITQKSLRSLISLVPQESFLFSETIDQSITLGLEVMPTVEAIQESARAVELHGEIEALPFGYGSELGERGVNLSGGQKQRLTLARAIIRNSPVIILDDSLSAVDHETEKLLLERLKRSIHQRMESQQTTIIISHRLASLKLAHRIVVFDQGKIEAVGTHEELLESSPFYRRLEELQGNSSDLFSRSESKGCDCI